MRIVVSSQAEKDELIRQSKYVHDFYVQVRGRKGRTVQWKGLDSDRAGILMHIYTAPDIITVIEPVPSIVTL